MATKYTDLVNINGTIKNRKTGKFYSTPEELAKDLGTSANQIKWDTIGTVDYADLENRNGTIYNKKTGKGYSTPEELAKDLGISANEIKFDTISTSKDTVTPTASVQEQKTTATATQNKLKETQQGTYKTSDTVYQTPDGTLWRIENGQRKGFTSREAWNERYPHGGSIAQVSAEEMERLPIAGYFNVGNTESTTPPPDTSKPFTGLEATPKQGADYQYTERQREQTVQTIAGIEQTPISADKLQQVYQARPDLQTAFDESGRGIGAFAGETLEGWALSYGYLEIPDLLSDYNPVNVIRQEFVVAGVNNISDEEIQPILEKLKRGYIFDLEDIQTEVYNHPKTLATPEAARVSAGLRTLIPYLPEFRAFDREQAEKEARQQAIEEESPFFETEKKELVEEADIMEGRIEEDYLRAKTYAEAQEESRLASQADFLGMQATQFEAQLKQLRKDMGAGAFGPRAGEKERRQGEEQDYEKKEQMRQFEAQLQAFQFGQETAKLGKERGKEDISRTKERGTRELEQQKKTSIGDATQFGIGEAKDIYQVQKSEYERSAVPTEDIYGRKFQSIFQRGLK